MATARHGGRVFESESSDYEFSSSSDESLLTDAGQLSLKPYMHEPPATRYTIDKCYEKWINRSTLLLFTVDSLNSE